MDRLKRVMLLVGLLFLTICIVGVANQSQFFGMQVLDMIKAKIAFTATINADGGALYLY
jgi:hypothetical protein